MIRGSDSHKVESITGSQRRGSCSYSVYERWHLLSRYSAYDYEVYEE